jgi:hypothetical protein
MLWTGRVMSGIVILFMIFDITIKLMRLKVVDDAMTELGYPTELAWWIGLMELVIIILYAIPRTAVLGAILFTGILGGAVATHLRVADPIFSHDLFGVYLGLLAWGGLYFRDEKLRALIPYRR